jgi:DNA-binding MarR family transcriptional regulator
MEMTINMLIYELAFRVRMYRMSKKSEKKKVGTLSDREALLMEILRMKDNVRISDICSLYPSVSSSTISNTISNLWKDKLVSKKINPHNQREITVSLTPKGKKIVEEIRNINTKVYEVITESLNLTEDEEKVCKRVLKKGIDFFDTARKV